MKDKLVQIFAFQAPTFWSPGKGLEGSNRLNGTHDSLIRNYAY